MDLFVTVVTGGLAHVPIFLKLWLVAATIILSRGFSRIDPSDRGGALRPGAAGAIIATILIVLIFLMVPARSLQGLSSLRTMRRHSLYFLGAEQKGALVPNMILNRFLGEAVALGAVSIYLTDLQKKVQGGLGLSRDSLLDGLVLGVLLTIFLLGLGMNGGPEAVAE